jgi:hypothetical protein
MSTPSANNALLGELVISLMGKSANVRISPARSIVILMIEVAKRT